MADNKETRAKVSKAANSLTRAKEAKLDQSDAREKLRKAIAEYDK